MEVSSKTYTRKRLRSLLLSLFFHSAFFLVFFYCAVDLKYSIQPPYHTEAGANRRPAQLSFQRFSQAPTLLQPAGQVSTAPRPTYPLQSTAPTRKKGIPHRSKEKTKTATKKQIQKKVEPRPIGVSQQTAPLIEKEVDYLVKQEVVSTQAESEKQRFPALSSSSVKEEQSTPLESREEKITEEELSYKTGEEEKTASSLNHPLPEQLPGVTEAASHDVPYVQQGSPRSSARTGAAVVNAFKGSYYKEQRAFEEQNALGPTAPVSDTQYVKESLREWESASYKNKIWTELIKCTRIHKKYLSIPTFFSKRLEFKLVVNKTGALKIDPQQPPTNIEQIDTYIDQFFSYVHLPPFPKRLNQEEISLIISIELTLAPGGNFVQLIPRVE